MPYFQIFWKGFFMENFDIGTPGREYGNEILCRLVGSPTNHEHLTLVLILMHIQLLCSMREHIRYVS